MPKIFLATKVITKQKTYRWTPCLIFNVNFSMFAWDFRVSTPIWRFSKRNNNKRRMKGFVLVAKLPFCPHLNRSCGEHMCLSSKYVTSSLQKCTLYAIIKLRGYMFDFKLDGIMCKICYRLGGTVQISPS